MNKKIITLSLLAMLSVCFLFSCGSKSDYTYETVEGGVVITGYTGEEVDIVIPSEIGKKKVVAIGESAFEAKLIESVEIPESVTEIGQYAFRRSGYLKSVTINGEIKVIKKGTFNFCQALEKIELPDTVETIENNAFGMSGLTEITLPDSVKVLEESVFYNCASLESFKSGKGLEEIGPVCFAGCLKLETVQLNEGLKLMGVGAFTSCPIQTIEIPSTVEVLENTVFTACSLTDYTVSSGIKTIKDRAFSGCAQMKKIYIPSTVETIEEGAFFSCKGLVICGERDSAAEIFADTYGFKFEEYNFD